MGDVVPMCPNYRTYERRRRGREAVKMRLIRRIGIILADAPLFSEELRFLAYEESLKHGRPRSK